MKIGIDARLYGLKNRGIGRYLENLIKNLEKIDQKNQYFIFLYKNNFSEYQPLNNNFKKVLINIRWYSLSEQIILPYLIKKYKIDLMHYPNFNAAIFGTKKYLVTIHDLTLLYYPDRRASTLSPFLYKIKYFLFKKLQKQVLKKTSYVITPSHYVKKDLLKNYLLNSEKIKVINEGVNQFKSSQNSIILKKYNITKPFLLYVGAAYPHKNLERMIKAFTKLNQNKQYQLIIVGLMDYFMKRLKNWVKNNNFSSEDIIFTDFLSDQELTALYQSAKIFVLPSLSEGFGLPGLEAQINYLPIASSNQTCLKEILGKGALYFNPFDVEDITEKIKELINNMTLQIKIKKIGENNVKKYNWLKTAQETLSLYQSCILNDRIN